MTDQKPRQKDLGAFIREAFGNFRHQPEIYFMTVMNFLPVYGVFFLDWEPLQAFGIYVLETIIIGVFHAIKLLVIMRVGQGDPPRPGKSGVSGYGAVGFFLFHYNFFVVVQLFLFTVIASIAGDHPPGDPMGFISYILHSRGSLMALGGIFLSHLIAFIVDFIMRGDYNRYTLSEAFFWPYKRIVIQQLVVLLGGFLSVLLFGAGMRFFVVLFCAIKAALDVIFYLYSQQNRLPSKAPVT